MSYKKKILNTIVVALGISEFILAHLSLKIKCFFLECFLLYFLPSLLFLGTSYPTNCEQGTCLLESCIKSLWYRLLHSLYNISHRAGKLAPATYKSIPFIPALRNKTFYISCTSCWMQFSRYYESGAPGHCPWIGWV